MPIIARLFVLLTIGLLSVPALGQGSVDDYRRAAELPGRYRNIILNERLNEYWINDHELVCRIQKERGRWEFVRFNALTGEQAPAFDHAAVARFLAEDARRDGRTRPGALNITRLTTDRRGRLLLLMQPQLEVLRINRDDSIERISIENVNDFRIPFERGRRSRNSSENAEVVFVNRTDRPMEMLWHDTNGGARSYGMIEPGGQRSQGTYVGHLWRIRDDVGGEYGRFRTPSGGGIVLIDDAIQPPAREPAPRDGQPQARRDISPDGSLRARIEDHNVIVEIIESGSVAVETSNGSADDSYRGPFHWSPDSRFVAVVQTVPAETHTVSIVETSPDDQVQPRLHQFNYLKPGDRIAHRRVRIIDVQRRRLVDYDEALCANPWAINNIRWAADSSELMFLYNQRGHQAVRLLAVNPRSGNLRAIINEESETFVDYSQKTFLRFIDDGDTILWASERSGWNHIYRIDRATGSVLNAVTSGDWLVRAVDEVDEERGAIRFRAMGVFDGQDPYHIHHGRAALDGSDLTWLTRSDGMHSIEASPDGTWIVDTWSRVDQPPVHELRRAETGELVFELSRATINERRVDDWVMPEPFMAKGRDGTTEIWGIIHRPSNFDPRNSYPVIEAIYAGPHGHHVPKSFRTWHGARSMAELGFVVVQIDGMGTNWRRKAFHDACWQNIGDAGFPDRIAWIKAAAKDRPWMDLSRVGIYGGSAGGQNALRALLAHPDFYHVAVADCGCHDNRMDKIWWNEAWMGWPIGDHYDEQSNVTQAHRLEGKLLLIVGEMDRNVDPASTMQVVDALIKADKDFDLLVMPGVGHGAAGTAYGRRRQADFFVRHLLDREPRWQ